MIRIAVNGEVREAEAPLSISEFLEQRGLHQRMVVVEHNLVILAREEFAEVMLQDGDTLEIVQMMAGG